MNFYYGDTSNNYEHSGDFVEDDIKPIIGTRETSQLGHEQPFFDLPQLGVDTKPVKDEHLVEPNNNGYPDDVNYSNDEPYLDAPEALSFGDEFYIETNDLTNPIEADPEGFDMLDEYLTFFDVDDDNVENMTFDSSANLGIENNVSQPDPINQYMTFDSSENIGIENNVSESDPTGQKVQINFQNCLKSVTWCFTMAFFI